MPAVTVCIPTYEPKPQHLRAAIDSVCAQSFSDWELVIHDDASSANVEEMARPFLDPPHIRFHRSPERLGIGGNWNACARLSKAPVIAYIFQDDLWDPEYLERAMNVLTTHDDVGFVALQHRYAIEGQTAASATGIYDEVRQARNQTLRDGRILHEEFLRTWIERGLRPNLIGEPSFVVFRKSLLDRAGWFSKDMRQGLDVDQWVRYLLHADGWWIAAESGAFRVHPSAATARNEESGAGRSDRMRTLRMLTRMAPPGEVRTLAKRACRRELLKMAWKWMKRKLQ